jgi:hypothetical protein
MFLGSRARPVLRADNFTAICEPNDHHGPPIAEEIRRISSHYGARLRTDPNHLAANLLGVPVNRRLRRYLPTDLPDRF